MSVQSLRGVTLMELIAVVVIIGIISVIAIPRYRTAKERTLGYEAKASLKLILAAEKIYRMESNKYYPSTASTVSSVASINTNLRLSLVDNNWKYSIQGNNLGTGFTAQARRDSTGCTYQISNTSTTGEPTAGSGCP